VSSAATVAPTHLRRPLWWFATLENALESGDLARAAEAQRRLKELGLRVEVITPWAGRDEPEGASDD
jgi:hypothetical protein